MRSRTRIHRRITSAGILTIMLLLPFCGARAEAIASGGRRIAQALDSMKVEEHWLPGDPVDWRTGEYSSAARRLKGHCSAFVAAVCAAFHLYILRPPDHSEWLLANAQCEWLRDQGPTHGWTRLDDGPMAQHMANEGNIVIACYKNPDRDDAGHIAIVRPSAKDSRRIASSGPDITQAGAHNYARTTAKIGFRLHSQAWKGSKILYYSHAIR